MLLINGLEEQQGLSKREIDFFLDGCENLVNISILGNISKIPQWCIVRAKDNSGVIGEINTDNKITRLIIKGLLALVNYFITDYDKHVMWLKSCE